MGLLSMIGGLVKPVGDIIDNLHTSDEEKGQLRNELIKMEHEVMSKVLDYEKELMKAQSTIITAEAAGASWIQRNWRPITMLTLLALVVMDQLGFLAFRIAPEAWTLIQLGMGGYIVGRSGEKIVKSLNGKKP